MTCRPLSSEHTHACMQPCDFIMMSHEQPARKLQCRYPSKRASSYHWRCMQSHLSSKSTVYSSKLTVYSNKGWLTLDCRRMPSAVTVTGLPEGSAYLSVASKYGKLLSAGIPLMLAAICLFWFRLRGPRWYTRPHGASVQPKQTRVTTDACRCGHVLVSLCAALFSAVWVCCCCSV